MFARLPSKRGLTLAILTFFGLGLNTLYSQKATDSGTVTAEKLEWIILNEAGDGFVKKESKEPFQAWGFNYDHDAPGRLLEDYWDEGWPMVREHFEGMKRLGANAVRIHLQFGKFMSGPDRPNPDAHRQLSRLIELAEKVGLYLNITGLGCYHKKDVPDWYDAMNEQERWNAQSVFWESVAITCKQSPAIFCYDLMNEPVLPGANGREEEWLLGELGGKFFVQRISLDRAGREGEEMVVAWLDRLTSAIRKHDEQHLITVGVIPWALTWPGAKPVFYSPRAAPYLDFVSVHFYPRKGEVAKALKALKVYDIGKPIVIEEMFPLHCGIEELGEFVEGSRAIADGWFGFYWGDKPFANEEGDEALIRAALYQQWLDFFRKSNPPTR